MKRPGLRVGLTRAEAAARRERHGPNEVLTRKTHPALVFLRKYGPTRPGWWRACANDGALSTFSFLLLLYFAAFSLVSARERSRFWATPPGKTLLAALVADVLVGTALTYVGIPGLEALARAGLGDLRLRHGILPGDQRRAEGRNDRLAGSPHRSSCCEGLSPSALRRLIQLPIKVIVQSITQLAPNDWHAFATTV